MGDREGGGEREHAREMRESQQRDARVPAARVQQREQRDSREREISRGFYGLSVISNDTR